MRVTHIGATGLLSFDDFSLNLDHRLTVVVGPNGAGKSNLGRVLELARRAVDSADRTSAELDDVLASFLAGRRAVLPPGGIEVRVGLELTDEFEKGLLVSYVQAVASSALLGNTAGVDPSAIEHWADYQLTGRRLSPLFAGEIVVCHSGSADGLWQVGFEFEVIATRSRRQRYRWVLRGNPSDSLVAVDDLRLLNLRGEQLGDRLRGRAGTRQGRPAAPAGRFSLARFLPRAATSVSCYLDLGRNPPLRAARTFADMIGVNPLGGPESNRHFGFARVLATVLRQGLIQTSDTRLLPTSSFSWSTPAGRLQPEDEGNLPEMLLCLRTRRPVSGRAGWKSRVASTT